MPDFVGRVVEYAVSGFFPYSFYMRRFSASSFLLSFLVALFLLGQTAAASHEFSHVRQGDADLAPDEVCVLCLAAAASSSAAPLPELPPFVLPVFRATVAVADVPVCFSSPCRAYWGRAPPALP